MMPKSTRACGTLCPPCPPPDLAAVFEDLPPEKMPVLFRLCPKDLAAEIFAELTPESQQNLIDGLTDKELKAVVDDLFVDDATDLVEVWLCVAMLCP